MTKKKSYPKKYARYEIRQSTEELTGTKIQYGSASYALLCYAAMKSRYSDPSFSPADVMYVLSGKLDKRSDVLRKINVLIRQNCLERVSDDRWKITEFGLEAREVFGWYGNTLTNSQIEKRKADKRKEPVGWEDQIDF